MPGRHDDISTMRRLLPNASYCAAVVRRQATFATLLAALVAVIGGVGVLLQKNTYASSVTAVYDPRDSAEIIPRHPSYPRFYQLQNSFKARLQSSAFLEQVATAMQLAQDAEVADFVAPQKYDAVTLRPMLEATTDERALLLTLKATDTTPNGAQRLADKAMELFIQTELQLEADQARTIYESFVGYLGDENERADRQKPEAHKVAAAIVDPVAADHRSRLEEREADLVDEIQSLRLEISDQANQRSARRSQLEAELASLQTRLKASHPDVIAKRAELELAGRDEGSGSRQATMSRLRSELTTVRDDQRRAGLPISSGTSLAEQKSFTRSQFVPSLTDRIGELGHERLNIDRQVNSPKNRTRLKVLLPASIDGSPSSNSRLKLALGLLALGSIAIFVLIILRETREPLARDEWRINSRTGLPLLASVPLQMLTAHEEITPTGVVTLKQQLGKQGGETSQGAQMLLTYRRINHALKRSAAGSSLLVVNVGAQARSARFLHNLVNLHAVDYGDSCLVIDCNHKNPIPPRTAHEVGKALDLVTYLGRKGVWTDVRLPRNDKSAYDLVPAPADLPADATSTYHSDAITKLFAAITKSYQAIFLRALPDSYFTENNALMAASTDCLLCIDASTTTFDDLDRTLALLDRTKIRGYVLLGA